MGRGEWLSRQTAGLGPGLILRVLPRSPLLSHWHDNGNHGPQKETNKERQVFNARAICQFSLGPFQEPRGVTAGAEEGVGRGRHENRSWEKQSPCEKKLRRAGARVDGWRAPEGPFSQAVNRSTTPSPMGLLSVAKHCTRYSQNMLLTEDFKYTNHKKRSPEWSSNLQATCLCKDYTGFVFFRSQTVLNTVV